MVINMAENWNWNDEENKELTIIPRVQALAVYRNEQNEIVLRQEGFDLSCEDQVIVIPEEKLGVVIATLQAELVVSSS